MSTSKARWVSHLVLFGIAVLALVLVFRLSPEADWLPGLSTEPLFDSEPNAVAEDSTAEEIPSTEMLSEVNPEDTAVEGALPVESVVPETSAPVRPATSAVLQESQEQLFADWGQARRLLRQRDLAGAEAAYQNLQRRWPDHPDLSGELGNVYVLMGEEELARQVFLRTQRQLLPLGPSVQLQAVTRWLDQHP